MHRSTSRLSAESPLCIDEQQSALSTLQAPSRRRVHALEGVLDRLRGRTSVVPHQGVDCFGLSGDGVAQEDVPGVRPTDHAVGEHLLHVLTQLHVDVLRPAELICIRNVAYLHRQLRVVALQVAVLIVLHHLPVPDEPADQHWGVPRNVLLEYVLARQLVVVVLVYPLALHVLFEAPQPRRVPPAVTPPSQLLIVGAVFWMQ